MLLLKYFSGFWILVFGFFLTAETAAPSPVEDTMKALFLFLLLPLQLLAQPDTLWTRTFALHTSTCYAMDSMSNGGYVVAGKWAETNNNDGPCGFLLMKINQDGDTVWTRRGENSRQTVCFAVEQTFDGNLMLAGRSTRGTVWDNVFWLMKMSVDGDSLWSRTFSFPGFTDSRGYAAVQTADSGFILAGMLSSTHYYDAATHVGLLKTNAQGDSLWSRSYQPQGYPVECRMIRQLDDGGFLVGFSSVTHGFGLLCTDANGDSLWSRSYFPDASVIYSVIPTRDGGYFFAGREGGWDNGWRWMKTDSNFDLLWSHTHSPNNPNGEAHAAIELPDGGFIIAGFGYSLGGFVMMRVTNQGSTMWMQNYPAGSNSECWAMLPRADGGYLLGGFDETAVRMAALTSDHYIPVAVYPTIVNFDSVRIGDTTASVVSLINLNQSEITISSINLTGYPVFSAECISPQPIPVGDSAAILVRCFPRYTRQLYGDLFIYLEGNAYPAIIPLTVWGLAAAAVDERDLIPRRAELFPNYPNPFNPETRISFDLPQSGRATLQIFDITGRIVATLLDGITAAGHHELAFNGATLPSGVYFYHLQAGDFSATRKMLLLK
jgi:hypothetical protein